MNAPLQTNILVQNGRVFISDFGVAASRHNRLDLSKRLLGSTRWLAPEIRELTRYGGASSATITVWSDMYSFGRLFLEVRDIPLTLF